MALHHHTIHETEIELFDNRIMAWTAKGFTVTFRGAYPMGSMMHYVAMLERELNV